MTVPLSLNEIQKIKKGKKKQRLHISIFFWFFLSFEIRYYKYENIYMSLEFIFSSISSYKNYTLESEHKKFDPKWVFNLIFSLSIKKRDKIFRTVEILSFFTSSRSLGLKDDSNVEFFSETFILFRSFFWSFFSPLFLERTIWKEKQSSISLHVFEEYRLLFWLFCK